MLLSPCVRLTRLLVIVVVGRPFPLVFGVEFAGLFENPIVSVGMIGRLIGGAVNLAKPIEYSVQTRWTVSVSFEWLLTLNGFGAAESGIDRHVFDILVVVSVLMLVASWLAIAAPGFGGARVAGAIASTSKPAILSRAKAGHTCGKGCHGLRLFLAEVSGKQLISDAMFEGCEGFDVRTIHSLVLFY